MRPSPPAIRPGSTTFRRAQLAKARRHRRHRAPRASSSASSPQDDAEAVRGRLTTTTAVAEAVRDAAMVIEAAPEKIDLKLALLGEVQAARARPTP